ncbi:MAG TPA: hypothetical protein VGB55_08735 [Tepidisphaeraceae bacterium]
MMRTVPTAALVAFCSARLFAQGAPESVYAPPELPRQGEGTNLGGVHFDVSLSYFTDYVYRGVEVFEAPGAEDQLNLQLDTKVSFDLGKLPHPFVSVFVNVGENDPISDFQEIRPILGFDWTLKPFVFSAGHISYIYPDRDAYETSEVFVKIALDDAVLFRGATVPAPYALAAYDYDLYDGLYLEAGIKYRVPFDDLGIQFTAIGNVAYVNGFNTRIEDAGGGLIPGFFTNQLTTGDSVSGFQHWQVGLIGEYSLNQLFDASSRYGVWSIRGYVFYTEGIDDDIRAENQLWGGAGITFQY